MKVPHILLGYIKTLTLAPCSNKKKIIINSSSQIGKRNRPNKDEFFNGYHGFGRKVRLELGANNTTVTMRPNDLSPNAAVMATVLLDLGLVYVSHFLPTVPCYLLLRVHALDLNQRSVWVLVRLRPIK